MHKRWCKVLGKLSIPGLVLLLAGCKRGVFSPEGSVGVQEMHLIIVAAIAMLTVVIPVIGMTLFFAWRYRATNTKAVYAPKWSHSTAVELAVWGIPTVIVVFLAVLTWRTTHELDPYKPLVSDVKPMNVDVVSLDWKWLFIYPQQGIATVNQLAMPVGTPVNFHITSDAVMNSFFIPRLGSQIYSMAGMVTQLHLVADHPGNFLGESANFSGAGFSDMEFRTLAMPPAQFKQWVQKVRDAKSDLTQANYKNLVKPSIKAPVQYFSKVDPTLFKSIVMKYMAPMKMTNAARNPHQMTAEMMGQEH